MMKSGLFFLTFFVLVIAFVVKSSADQPPNRPISEGFETHGEKNEKTSRWGNKPTVEKSVCNLPAKKFTNNLGMVFQYIPPGSFLMGTPSSEPQRHVNELQHRVTLSTGFYMQNTEVTQKQWKEVMGENPSEFKECGDDCPVDRVSWNEVQSFIGKLNQMQKTERYRLPTEAEWEYACRAGMETAFSSGTCLISDQANFNGQAPLPECPKGKYRGSPLPVASFSPNAWGLYDMHGNVWEWCQDWYGKYPSKPVIDPTGPHSGTDHVNRGGGWGSQARNCRAGSRYWNYPDYWDNSVGFRLVYDP